MNPKEVLEFAKKNKCVMFDLKFTDWPGVWQHISHPIWMLDELVRPRQRPVTNVVAIVVFAATFLPILGAYYLTRGGEETAGGGK